MAGITNAAFRRLCREQGGGLYVCEMITTRALVERDPKTLRMIAFGDDETAAQPPALRHRPGDHRRGRADPRRRGPRRPHRPQLRLPGPQGDPQGRRRGAAVASAGSSRDSCRPRWAAAPAGVPVTVKMRKGIDDDHLTYSKPGLAAQDAGVAAVALHGRTAAQRYSGTADWDAIATPQAGRSTSRCSATATSGRPTTRCGWSRRPACDGVVVGRGCLGRPWLFADLAAAFDGRPERRLPTLGEVAVIMRRHAELLVDQRGRCPQPGPGRAGRLHRLPQARRLVPQGLPGRRRAAPLAGDGRQPGRARRPARQARPDRAVPGGRARAAARAHQLARARSPCPRAGWPAGTTTPSPRAPRWTTPAAEPAPAGRAETPGGHALPGVVLTSAESWQRSSAPCRADVVNESPLGSTRLRSARPGPDCLRHQLQNGP